MKDWPKVFLALDLPSIELDELLEEVGSFHLGYKVGLKTILSKELGDVVKRIQKGKGCLFLDAKLHDIPNTVANAARSLAKFGARFFTVHASGGRDMMKAAREAAAECAEGSGTDFTPEPIAVTVLTSMSQAMWSGLFETSLSVQEQVLRLVEEAHSAGVRAVVASPLEVEAIKSRFKDDMSVVTPGVRPEWASKGDQKRVATPGDAIKAGAAALVIGRPILSPPAHVGGRRRAVELIAEEIGGL